MVTTRVALGCSGGCIIRRPLLWEHAVMLMHRKLIFVRLVTPLTRPCNRKELLSVSGLPPLPRWEQFLKRIPRCFNSSLYVTSQMTCDLRHSAARERIQGRTVVRPLCFFVVLALSSCAINSNVRENPINEARACW